MRFHSLNRLLVRSCSYCSIVTPSTPAAPLLALTLRYASQTTRLEISNGLTRDFDSLTWLLPESWLTTKRTRTTRPLRSSPITGPSPLLRDGPPPCPASVLSPSQFQLLEVLPYADRSNTRPDPSRRGVPTFHTGA